MHSEQRRPTGRIDSAMRAKGQSSPRRRRSSLGWEGKGMQEAKAQKELEKQQELDRIRRQKDLQARNMTAAACGMQHTACNVQHASCSIQHATCNIQQHATCNIQQHAPPPAAAPRHAHLAFAASLLAAARASQRGPARCRALRSIRIGRSAHRFVRTGGQEKGRRGRRRPRSRAAGA